MISATGLLEPCAVSVWTSLNNRSRQTSCVVTSLPGNPMQNTHRLNCTHIASALRVQVLHTVQCKLRCNNGSSNVQITKQASSLFCSECLPLVTDITFSNNMLFGLRLGLCLSNNHRIILLIPHCRSSNVTNGFIFYSFQIHHLNFLTHVSQFPHSLPFPPLIKSP